MKTFLTPPSPDREGGVYRFWRDPVCMASWALYIVNRFVLIPAFAAAFPLLREHLGDSLLIPAALPPMLWVQSLFNVRHGSGAPTWREIVVWTVLSSLFFEFFGPRLLHHSVGDWGDVVAYWVGAILAGAIWNWRHTAHAPQPESTS